MKKERNESMPDDDICTFYDYSLHIDHLLFQKNYKPLIVIIASELIDGINRVTNISHSKRIVSKEFTIQNSRYMLKIHKMIEDNFYLFEANNMYYFVYPVNSLHNLFTIYCQKMLLNNLVGVTFHFVNVKKEYPFFEDILIPLQQSCTKCPLVEYVNQKLQTGKSFSELFTLREQLFRAKTKYTSLKTLDNNYDCASIGFNINFQNKTFLLYFNSLLQKIQKSNNVNESKQASFFERSLKCFKSRNIYVTNEIFYDDIREKNLKHPFTGINYLNWINETIFSLRKNDSSFGNICKDEHKMYTFKLFCFIKDVSDITSYNIATWVYTLQQLVAKSLTKELKWFNSLMTVYQEEYILKNDSISHKFENLKKQIPNEVLHWNSVMHTSFNLVFNLMVSNEKYNQGCHNNFNFHRPKTQ